MVPKGRARAVVVDGEPVTEPVETEPAWLGKVRDKLTQADQEEINGVRLGGDEAVKAARKRKDALERSSMPPQRRATPQGRQEA